MATPDTAAGEAALERFVLGDNIAHLMRRAHFRNEKLFADEFADLAITPRQKALLVAIHQHPGATVSQVAKEIAVDRQTTAEMLARMVERGYIERRRSSDDGRAYAVALTAAGERLLIEVMPRDDRVSERIIAPLPPEYRALFKKCLGLLLGIQAEPGATAADPEVGSPSKEQDLA